MSLKFTGESCVMTMKNCAKFGEELTCQFKIDMRNLMNFDWSTQKAQKFALSWAAFDQSISFLSYKSTEELCLIALNIGVKFEGKLTCAFKNNMSNLANFHQSMFESLKIGTFIGSFYPK